MDSGDSSLQRLLSRRKIMSLSTYFLMFISCIIIFIAIIGQKSQANSNDISHFSFQANKIFKNVDNTISIANDTLRDDNIIKSDNNLNIPIIFQKRFKRLVFFLKKLLIVFTPLQFLSRFLPSHHSVSFTSSSVKVDEIRNKTISTSIRKQVKNDLHYLKLSERQYIMVSETMQYLQDNKRYLFQLAKDNQILLSPFWIYQYFEGTDWVGNYHGADMLYAIEQTILWRNEEKWHLFDFQKYQKTFNHDLVHVSLNVDKLQRPIVYVKLGNFKKGEDPMNYVKILIASMERYVISITNK